MGMDCLEPAYLNLPGWRCVPVYALPLSPTSPRPPVTPPPSTDQLMVPQHLPPDPRQWSRQQVFTWMEWCVEHFSFPPLDNEHFYMNGKGLCLLQKKDFRERAPQCGDVLYNVLQILLSQSKEKTHSSENISAAFLQLAAQEKERVVESGPWSVSSDFHNMGHVIHENLFNSNNTGSDSTTAGSPPLPSADAAHRNPTQSLPLTQLSEVSNTTTEKINVRLLWDFLQQLLNDAEGRYLNCIVWKDRPRGVFKITDPHRLAALWGRQKNHLNMNFDKMSRALRYYYRVRILQKEPGERHCYRFLRHPNELRHCNQRALLTRDTPTLLRESETALDMSIKEEGAAPIDI